MSRYRHQLPQLQGHTLITDGGLETTLVFHEGLDLPEFAAYTLLESDSGRHILQDYFDRYTGIARHYQRGFVLESVTWRANPDWCARIGHSPEDMHRINREAIEFLQPLRDKYDSPATPYVISGCIGPRHDAYAPELIMSAAEAETYHWPQIKTLAGTDADCVTAMTLTNVNEATGIARAAQKAGIPVVISFTVETDGCLPTGETLDEAITQVDQATGAGPAYYMINCAHPTHFGEQLAASRQRHRIRGLRANASKCSHAELDGCEQLDQGNPQELGQEYQHLLALLPHISVLGGCCGTDHRHIEQICCQSAGLRQVS
ncbi:homocysteine S-methyltransferase family protein [Pseudomaricurvus sp. HS19]|uniref:homocysteine S-methyltransferase family protein n=1 Tax=Pseudomaricurvus sp. HS19 TaxID=2692626 RepID=UPI001371EDCA|nr:homocysteine S-methyltransferase family protein [Pseudomaricurvus sp. HS19]MYM63883.1 homocysteine S-methyltransferase [Pseudomaricurvus sp. HS19]